MSNESDPMQTDIVYWVPSLNAVYAMLLVYFINTSVAVIWLISGLSTGCDLFLFLSDKLFLVLTWCRLWFVPVSFWQNFSRVDLMQAVICSCFFLTNFFSCWPDAGCDLFLFLSDKLFLVLTWCRLWFVPVSFWQNFSRVDLMQAVICSCFFLTNFFSCWLDAGCDLFLFLSDKIFLVLTWCRLWFVPVSFCQTFSLVDKLFLVVL